MPRKTAKTKPKRRKPPLVIGPNPVKQAAFLKAYVIAGANVTAAAVVAKINRSTHYDWLAHDETYPQRFEAARQAACEAVEYEIFRRGQLGYEEPIVYQGVISTDNEGAPITVRKFSDTLLIFRAKALMPERYGDKTKLEHSGGVDTGTIKVVFDEDWCGNDAHEKARQSDAPRDPAP
jgi:hypothetical protein